MTATRRPGMTNHDIASALAVAAVMEGIEVILAEMAKWHAALEALHQDVRQIKRCVEDKRAEGA